MASWTFWIVFSDRYPFLLMTRETVVGLTPASLATSVSFATIIKFVVSSSRVSRLDQDSILISMWEDPTRKYFFSFIDKDFKYRIVNENISSCRLVSDCAATARTEILGILLTSLATIDCDQSYQHQMWELSPFLLHLQRGRFRFGYLFQTAIPIHSSSWFEPCWQMPHTQLASPWSLQLGIGRACRLWWLILWPVRELLGSHRNPLDKKRLEDLAS